MIQPGFSDLAPETHEDLSRPSGDRFANKIDAYYAELIIAIFNICLLVAVYRLLRTILSHFAGPSYRRSAYCFEIGDEQCKCLKRRRTSL